jgi:hypothetical protein
MKIPPAATFACLLSIAIAMGACDAFMLIGMLHPSKSSASESRGSLMVPSPESFANDFRKIVDDSVTGEMIAAHPYRYVAKRVDLHCTVTALDSSWFDAACSKIRTNDIIGDTIIDAPGYARSAMKVGQHIEVLGTIEAPWTAGLDKECFPAIRAAMLRWENDPRKRSETWPYRFDPPKPALSNPA